MWHEWSPLKKLIWLRRFASGVSYVLKTVTGALIHITDAIAAPVEALSVSIEPVQDLNGYASPWPAGGGVNILPPRTSSANIYNAGHLIPVASGETVYVYGEWTYTTSANMYVRVFDNEGETNKNGSGVNPTGSYFNSGNAKSFVMPRDGYLGICYNAGVATYTIEKMMVSRSPIASTTDYSPYSNICPISGWDSVDVWVQPPHDTTAEPTATIQLGQTVYGGTLDVVNGTLTVDRANIESYAGETLPGEWISSMDVYSAGTTPTIGAQVAYKLATPFEIPLTPTQIATLQGTNNVWSDAGDVTMTYRASAS